MEKSSLRGLITFESDAAAGFLPPPRRDVVKTLLLLGLYLMTWIDYIVQMNSANFDRDVVQK